MLIKIGMHVVNAVVHNCGRHILASYSQRPRTLNVQIESGLATTLASVFLKIQNVKFNSSAALLQISPAIMIHVPSTTDIDSTDQLASAC